MRYTHSCRQSAQSVRNWEWLDRLDFWMMSNSVERRWNRKCLWHTTTKSLIKIRIPTLKNSTHNSEFLLSPIAERITSTVELIYKIRLPNVLIFSKKKQLPAILVKLRISAALFTSIGMPNARITCTRYGRHTTAPPNSRKKFKKITKMNGFMLRLCRSSLILSTALAFGWWHLMDCCAHETHAVESSVWFCSLMNSSWTVSGSTQPRNHCNDRCASFGRSFDSSQFGVSGMKQIAMTMTMGRTAIHNATWRQVKNVPSKNMTA